MVFFVFMMVEQTDMYQNNSLSLFQFRRFLTIVYHGIISFQDLVHCTVFKTQKLRNCSVCTVIDTERWTKFRKWMVLCHYISPSCGNYIFRIHWCLSVMIKVNSSLTFYCIWEWQISIFYFATNGALLTVALLEPAFCNNHSS